MGHLICLVFFVLILWKFRDFIMSSNRVVDLMEDPGYNHFVWRPKIALQRKHHAHGFRRLETLSGVKWTSETIQVLHMSIRFFFITAPCVPELWHVSGSWLLGGSHLCDAVLRIIDGLRHSVAKVDKYFLLTMSCKETLYLCSTTCRQRCRQQKRVSVVVKWWPTGAGEGCQYRMNVNLSLCENFGIGCMSYWWAPTSPKIGLPKMKIAFQPSFSGAIS